MRKKILITGAAGFIGSHLTDYLLKKNYSITAFDRYNSFNSFGWLEGYNKKKLKCVFGDIRDFDSVSNVVKNHDIVIHLAALIGIPYSYISPSAYIKTNVEGTYNVLEACRNNRTKQVIITSTSETYGTAESFKISENHPLKAQSPYSASKISADQLAMSYYRSFNTPVKIVRPFNTYGPRQSLRAVIPTIINQALSSNKITLGNINTARDLTFVKDTCDAFYKVMNCKNLIGQTVNVGSDNDISIKSIVKKISDILNKKISIQISKKRTRPSRSEVLRLRCNNKKIKSFTRWKPKYSLNKGLIETIEWNLKRYKKNENSKKYVV